jgi:hypothetical protein
MFLGATMAGWHLGEAWKRPVRHNKRIERTALWYALEVDKDYAEVLSMPKPFSLLRDLRPEAEVEERYEVQAAMHTIHHHLPFTAEERNVLHRAQSMSHDSFEGESVAARGPALVQRWHSWVWEDERQVPQTSVEALGASAIVAEGYFRLTQSLPRFLGWETGK